MTEPLKPSKFSPDYVVSETCDECETCGAPLVVAFHTSGSELVHAGSESYWCAPATDGNGVPVR